VWKILASDLTWAWRVWVSTALVAATAAAAGSVPAALVETGIGVGGLRGLGILSIASTAIVFTTIAFVGVLAQVLRSTVRSRRATFALWQLAGLLPGQTFAVVFIQIMITAAAGAALGTVASAPFAAPLVEYGLTGASGLGNVEANYGGLSLLAVGAAVVVVAAISAASASRDASRSRLVSTVSSTDRALRPSKVRLVAGFALVALSVAMLSSLPASLKSGGGQALLIGPILIAATASAGSPIFGIVTRLWTAAFRSSSTTVYIARSAALANVKSDSTVLSALIVAIGLPTAFISGELTIRTALSRSADGRVDAAALLLLFGPVLLGVVGSTLAVYFSAAQRVRASAQLEVAGVSPRATVVVAAVEAIMKWGTATLLVTAVVAITASAESLLLRQVSATVVPKFGAMVLGILALLCLALIVTASSLPVILSRRRELPARLSAP